MEKYPHTAATPVETDRVTPTGRHIGLVLFDDVPPMDVLLHPGGQGTRPLLTNHEHLNWVRSQRLLYRCSPAYAPEPSSTPRPAS